MAAITVTDLNNAKTDVDHIAAIATSAALTATDRLGNTKNTMAGAIATISAITNRGAWATATVYASKDLVSDSGTWYICVVPHTSAALFATDAANWRVYQGVMDADLASTANGKGASKVGVEDAAGNLTAANVEAAIAEIFAGHGRVVSSIAALKALSKTASTTKACVTGYYAAGDGGGGFYRYDSTDTTSADNGGTVIVATDGGRWKLIVAESVSVKQFGVKSDGTAAAANLTAFQAAITWCEDNLKALHIPGNDVSQTYLIGGKLTISKPLVMKGDGSHVVTLMGSGLAAGTNLLEVDGTAHGTFERAEISGFTLMPGAGVDCMLLKNASASLLNDIGIRTCRHGITYTGTRAFSNTFRKITPITAVTGETFRFVAHTGGGGHSFYDCTFGGSVGFSLDDATVTDGINFYNPNFEQCTSYGASITGTVKGLVFSGGRTEGGNDIDILINPTAANIVAGLSINGVEFDASDNGAVTRIRLGGAGGKVRGFNISGNSVGHAANNFAAPFVTLNGDGESGVISGNYLNGPIASCSAVSTLRSGVSVFSNEGNNGKFAEHLGPEGSFTPTDQSGAALTFTSAAGTYTQFGRMVFWQAVVTYPVTANASDSVIGGLPFTINSLSGASQGRSGGNISATDSAVVGILQIGGGTTMWPYKASGVRATNADLSGKFMYLSGMYVIA